MKTTSLFFSAFLIISTAVSAQSYLSINNLKIGLTKSGGLYNDSTHNEFKIKDAQETSVAVAGSLWLSGYRDTALGVAAQTYYLEGSAMYGTDFQAGPITNDYQDAVYKTKFDRLWKVSRSQIDDHRNNFQIAGYVVPAAISEWPPHGDTNRGEAFHLAPFQDLDADGVYEPQIGEYPLIRGDEAVYMIYNDDQLHALSGSSSLGVEIHLMAYAFDALNDTALHNTLFLHYRIHNPGITDIDSLTAAHWVHPSLGNPNDDLIGSDSILGLSYYYNGDADDEGPLGFGNFPPAVGMMFLNEKAAGSGYYVFSGSAPQAMKEPVVAMDYYHLMRQKWKNGYPLLAEIPGDGYAPPGSGYSKTRWAFNGAAGWLESTNLSRDIVILMSFPQQTLWAGEDLCLDLAVMYARDSNNAGIFASLNKLKTVASEVKQFYNSEGYSCMNSNIGSTETSIPEFQLFPNPVKRYFVLKSQTAVKQVVIYSLAGEKLQIIRLAGKGEYRIELSERIHPGMYISTIHFETGEVLNQKIIIEE